MTLSIFIIILSTFSKSQWNELEQPFGRVSPEYISINEDYNLIINSYEIYKTNSNWQELRKIETDLFDEMGYITDVFSYNNVVYISAIEDSRNGKKGGVYYSTDKGESWDVMSRSMQKLNFYGFKSNNEFAVFLNNQGFHRQKYGEELIKNNVYLKDNDSLKINANSLFIDEENNFLLVERYSNGGKILHVKDTSQLFNEIFKNQLNVSIKDIFWNKDTILLATSNGIYYTNDFGKDWKYYSSILNNSHFLKINLFNNKIYLVNNLNQVIYAQLTENLNTADWKVILNNKAHYNINLYQKNDNLYLGSSNGLYYFDNTKNTFNEIELNIKSSNHQIENFKNDMLLLTYNKGLFNYNFKKNDWEILNDSLNQNGFPYNSFTLNNETIYSISTNYKSLAFSIDEGKNWNESFMFNNDFPLYINYNNGRIFVVSFSGIYYYSDDNGNSWNEKIIEINNINYSIYNIYNIDNILYCGTRGSGIIISVDNGETWELLSKDNQIISFEHIKSIVKHEESVVCLTSYNKMLLSADNGETWIESIGIDSNLDIYKMINYNNNIFIYTNKGFLYSKDFGNNFIEFNSGFEGKDTNDFKDIDIIDNKMILTFYRNIFYLSLNELGIEYTSVEKTEKRNYLYTFPPFPQPTKNEVKINTYWDSSLPFASEDIEIYNIAGIKINTEDKLRILKETNYNGQIIWDTSNEQAGIYIVNIKHGTESRTQKVMVEK